MRLGPYCGALLCGLSELRLRDAQLELATPSLFADMSGLRRLDLEGCTALRAGSWLSRVLTAGGAGSDVIPLPAGLQELRAMRSNVFDKCALELGAATGGCRGVALVSPLQTALPVPHTSSAQQAVAAASAQQRCAASRARWLAAQTADEAARCAPASVACRPAPGGAVLGGAAAGQPEACGGRRSAGRAHCGGGARGVAPRPGRGGSQSLPG